MEYKSHGNGITKCLKAFYIVCCLPITKLWYHLNADKSIHLGPSFIALEAPGDLSVELTLTADVSIDVDTTGSAWLLDVRAGGKL